MLIKSKRVTNALTMQNLADTVLENGDIAEGIWRENIDSEIFFSFQVPRSGHNATNAAKTVRNNFKDYLVNEGAVPWKWKMG